MNEFTVWDTSNYDCPVSPETVVEVIDVGGYKRIGPAYSWYWFYQGWGSDIIAYRVV